MTDVVTLPLARVENANRDYIRALGELVVMSSRLDLVAGSLSTTLTVDGSGRRSTVARHRSNDPAGRWLGAAAELLDVRDRLFSSVATTRFTGTTSEAVLLTLADGTVIPADAEFVHSICRRMARLEQIGLSLRAGIEDSTGVTA